MYNCPLQLAGDPLHQAGAGYIDQSVHLIFLIFNSTLPLLLAASTPLPTLAKWPQLKTFYRRLVSLISGIFTNHITCIHSITRYEPLVPKYGSSKRSESQSILLQTVIGRVSPCWHCDCSDFPVIYEPSLHFNGADQKLAGCMLISNIDQPSQPSPAQPAQPSSFPPKLVFCGASSASSQQPAARGGKSWNYQFSNLQPAGAGEDMWWWEGSSRDEWQYCVLCLPSLQRVSSIHI